MTKIKNVLQSDSSLVVEFSDHQKLEFPYVWLRYASPDPGTFDPDTQQRVLEVTDIDPDVQPKQVSFESSRLTVAWKGSVSNFTADDLIQATQRNADQLPEPGAWMPESLNDLSVFDFSQLQTDARTQLDFLTCFFRSGLARVKNMAPLPHQVGRLIELFGFVRETNYGKIFDVVAEINPSHPAYSPVGLSPHSDNNYRLSTPSVQALHCLQNDALGGDSTFVDGFRAARDLKSQHPKFFETLTTTPVRFEYTDADTSLFAEKPLIEIDRLGRLKAVHMNERTTSPFCVLPAKAEEFFEAFQCWAEMSYDSKRVYSFRQKPGDAVLFNNHRLLHGRTPYQEDNGREMKRHLQGCYSDIDAFESAYRVLRRSQNNG